MITENLSLGNFTILEKEKYDLGRTKKRHGGVLELSDAEFERLIKARWQKWRVNMLYPQENKIRGIIDLNGVWDFALGTTEEPKDTVTLPDQMEPIAVPASYNDQKDDITYRNHYGYAYYRRNITVPSYIRGQRLVLRFDAVTHYAKIYLNGTLLTQHKGGFLPFEVDNTDKLCAGESAELVVAVDNRINHSTLPVGNEEGTSFMGADNAGVPGVLGFVSLAGAVYGFVRLYENKKS